MRLSCNGEQSSTRRQCIVGDESNCPRSRSAAWAFVSLGRCGSGAVPRGERESAGNRYDC